MRQDIAEKLAIYYRDSIPGYILDAGRTFLKIHAGADFTDYQDIKVTIGDLARYYAHEACNITSGCRTIGDLTGDWRQIDSLAKECLEWFKYINIEGIRKPYIRNPHSTFHILQL